MANNTTPLKKFSMPYGKATQTSRVMRNSFILYKSEFIKFDPDYDDPYSDNWLTAITTAEACGSDDTIRAVQTGETANVESVMEKCRAKFRETMHFAEKAFPNNTPVLNEFGDNTYRKIKSSQPEMAKFMRNLYKVSKKYSTNLIAVKYTDAQIEESDALAKQLTKADEDQEGKKNERPVETQDRIEKHNTMWDFTSNVARDGKVIFKDDEAKRKLFILTDGEDNTTPPQTPPEPPAK